MVNKKNKIVNKMVNKMNKKKIENIVNVFMVFVMMIVLTGSVFGVSADFLNSDPYPVKTGKYADIRISLSDIGIDNSDSELVNGEIKFIDSYPLKLVDETSRVKVFTLASNHAEDFYQLIEYRVLVDSDAPDGIAMMKVELNVDGKIQIKTIDVKLEQDSAEFDVGNVKTSPERIYPDTSDVSLDIDIANFGDSDLKNCIVEISSDSLTSAYSMSDRFSLGVLNKDETKTAEFVVDILDGIDPGVYDLNVKLIYIEDSSLNSKKESKTMKLKLNVLGKPEFIVETVGTESIKQGKSGEITFNIKNVGSDKAEQVGVDLIRDSDIEIDFDKYSSFVGDLESNSDGEAYFTFSVGRDAEIKKNPISISVRYVFEDEVFTKTFSTYIDVIKRDKSVFENPIFLSIAGLLVIVFGIIFKKKKDVIKERVSNRLNRNN